MTYIVSYKVKGKVFPYYFSSVGPGADPGVQAVSPQVTLSHPPGGRLPLLSAFPAEERHRHQAGTKLYYLVRHMRVSNLPKVVTWTRTSDLLGRERTLYTVKLAFHDADILAEFLARIFAGMSACRARILARKSVSVSASWNAVFTPHRRPFCVVWDVKR